MYSLLFRNRWFAAAWVALTLASVWVFAGKDGGADRIGQSVSQLQMQRETMQPPVISPPVVAPPAPKAQKRKMPQLETLPGSDADPMNPKVGDVFVNPLTGQRVRAVRRSDQEQSTIDERFAD